MYKQNTIEWDLYQVYKHFHDKEREIFYDIPFDKNAAHWKVYIDIDLILTEQDTWLPFESKYFWALNLFWNINWSVGVGLFWINQDIKDTFNNIANRYIRVYNEKDEVLDTLEEKYGSETYNRASHASIAHKAYNS